MKVKVIKFTDNPLQKINASITELNSIKSSLIKPTNEKNREVYIKLLEHIDTVEEKLNNLEQLNQFYKINPKNINRDDIVNAYQNLTNEIENIKHEYSKLVLQSDLSIYNQIQDLTEEIIQLIEEDSKDDAIIKTKQIQDLIKNYTKKIE